MMNGETGSRARAVLHIFAARRALLLGAAALVQAARQEDEVCSEPLQTKKLGRCGNSDSKLSSHTPAALQALSRDFGLVLEIGRSESIAFV